MLDAVATPFSRSYTSSTRGDSERQTQRQQIVTKVDSQDLDSVVTKVAFVGVFFILRWARGSTFFLPALYRPDQ